MNTTWARLVPIAGLCLSLLLALAAPALAAASAQTVRQSFVQTSPDINECSGLPVTVTINGDTVLHITEGPDASVSATVATTGTLTLTPDTAGPPTYSGRLTDLFSGHGYVDPATGEIDVRAMTSVHNVILHGTDGSLIRVHGTAHTTLRPDGSLAVSFDRSTYACP